MQKEEIKNEEKELTSWQKIKSIFLSNSVTGDYNPKLYLITQCVFAGSITGFVLGGRIGARIGGVTHIESTKLAVYKSVAHAQRQYQSKVIVGFFQNGCRYGWRAGLFSGLYSFLMVAFTEVQPTYKNANFVAAGACTGLIYKSLSGWRSMVVASVVGGGLSVPVALLTSAVTMVAPENMKDKLDVFGSGYSLDFVKKKKDYESEIGNREKNLDDIIQHLEEDIKSTSVISNNESDDQEVKQEGC